jgi:hypothetical protein
MYSGISPNCISMQDQLRARSRPIDWKKVEAIQKEIPALPILDSRTDDEILGYDEFGIPVRQHER